MKKIALVLALLSALFVSYACLNAETKELKNGLIVSKDIDPLVPSQHRFLNVTDRLVRSLDSLYKATKDVGYLSDKGYVLMLQGKYKEAITLYLDIEKVHPNRYSTASNVGTAYELIGNNEAALQWIKKAIKIDSNSHQGSEWLHVAILVAKLKADQPVTDISLIGTSFGEEAVPKTELTAASLSDLVKHLYYQLQERMSFVKPKDQIVAQLLFELGNVHLLLQNKPAALEIYKKAEAYGFTSFLIKQRMDVAEGKKPRAIPVEKPIVNLAWVYWMSGILVFSAAFFFWLKSKRNLNVNR